MGADILVSKLYVYRASGPRLRNTSLLFRDKILDMELLKINHIES